MKRIESFFKLDKMFLLVLILVATTNFVFAISHEYWRDETQAWLIAKDCSLTSDSIFTVTSYEGHPFLWFLLLMPFAKAGINVGILKFITWSIQVATLAIFLYKTKIPILLKVALSFTPAFIYFYVVPARSYALAAMLTICITVLYNERKQHPILYGIFLSLLLQTLIIMAGFVIALSFFWFVETVIELFSGKRRGIIWQIVGMAIVLVNALFLLWEFRFTTIGGGEKNSLIEIAVKLADELVLGFNKLFGKYGLVELVIVLLFLVASFWFNKRSRVELSIFILSILWQIYIYAFIYYNENHRVITWIYLLLFLFNAFYSKGFKKKYVRVLADGVLWIIVLLSWNYEYNYLPLKDVETNKVFSYGKEIADVINQLPDGEVVLSLCPDRDSAVVAQVDDDHEVINPNTWDKATFANRNGDQYMWFGIDELYERIRSHYPRKKSVYAIVSSEASNVIGMNEYVTEYHDDFTIYYETKHNSIMDDYYLVKLLIR